MSDPGLWCFSVAFDFRDKRVLLLQGPIGPFFRRLAADLRQANAQVFKINFNGGDWLFYPTRATAFRGRRADWPAFFDQFLTEHQIDIVMLFGDCRPLHQAAHDICSARNIEVGVFEEGYVRPDFISLEPFGVNGRSQLTRDPAFYRKAAAVRENPRSVGNAFWYVMTWAMLYNTAGRLLSFAFPHYRHHRSLTITEGLLWLRSLWRKFYYDIRERGIQHRLETELANRFFLVPLQVHNDAQIYQHSDFPSVEDFIVQVMDSFAADAPADLTLVIKHHPLDRGCKDYSAWIDDHAESRGLTGRILYLHDQHLPSLLKHARGIVVINSTVGLSALHHGTPVKLCGRAIYDIAGLVYPGTLAEFWKQPRPGDPELYRKFRSVLIRRAQINGSFYRRLPMNGSHAGIRVLS